MDVQKFAEIILEHEPKIIFVGVVESRADTVLANRIRQGASLYYPLQYMRDFLMIGPALAIGALEKLKPALGAISAVTVRYERRILLLSRYEDMIVILGFEETMPTPFSDSMTKLIQEAAKESE